MSREQIEAVLKEWKEIKKMYCSPYSEDHVDIGNMFYIASKLADAIENKPLSISQAQDDAFYADAYKK